MPCGEDGAAVGLNSIGTKEFRAEFYALNARPDDGLSLDRRPDAISYDYLTAFSLGPVQLGDFSGGPVDRTWYVRASGNQIFAARENDDHDGFDDETFVFQFAGALPIELDAAFDQSAHILVAMERPTGVGGSSEIWIYYFDPFSSSYQLVNFGRGRTPRAVLDDFVDSSNADILVFYLADDTGMCWRQQRERYLIERVVTDVAPTIPDTGLMVMQGPVSFTYIFPPQVGVPGDAAFASYPIRASTPFPFTGPDASSLDTYPYDPTFQIQSSAGTLRLFEDPPGVKSYYPMTGFQGVIEDPFFEDYGPIVSHRDYGATITFPETAYYAEIETWNSFFGGGSVKAIDDLGTALSVHTFGAGDTSGTRELAYVYSQLGFKRLVLQSSAGDSRKWANIRYSTSQIPGIVIPTPFDLPNTYLEDVYRSTSGRVVIIYSVHDPVLGQYSLGTKATALYPQNLPADNFAQFKTVPISGIVPKVLRYLQQPGTLDPIGGVPDAFDEVEEWQQLHTTPVDTSELISIVITHALYDVDEWQLFQTEPLSGELLLVLLFHTLYDVDEYQLFQTEPVSGILVLVVIVHVLYDVDAMKVTHTTPVSSGSSLI